MKRILLLTSFVIVLSINQTIGQETSSQNSDYFKVEILQDGKVIEKQNGIIQLKKKPFKFKLSLFKVDGIDVSNSWGKYYYDYPEDKNIYECNDDRFFKDCRFVAVKTGSDDPFNENKDIFVGDGDYQFHWFYKEEMDWHRLDKDVKVVDGVTYATVTVENIYDVDKRDSGDYPDSAFDYPIEKINQDIYTVFAAGHWEREKGTKELQREKFILKFY